MPSPLGHALGALTVCLVADREGNLRARRGRALVAMAAAVAPDIDLLFKYVDGRNHHQAETHSVGAALLAGIVVALVARGRRLPRPAMWGLLAGLGWASH